MLCAILQHIIKNSIVWHIRPYSPMKVTVFCLIYSSALKMEAIYSLETSVDFQRTTQCYITEDTMHCNHRYENSHTPSSKSKTSHTPWSRCKTSHTRSPKSITLHTPWSQGETSHILASWSDTSSTSFHWRLNSYLKLRVILHYKH
jgi:hypothetical protein